MLNTDRLLIFNDLVEEKSFTEVAKKRGVTKAAVSKQIALLESECGVQLFDRTSFPVTPTDYGMEVYEKTRGLKKTLTEVEAVLGQFKSIPQGVLRVSASASFVNVYLFPYLKTWLEKYPLVTLDLHIDELIRDIEKENFDIVMGYVVSGPPSTIQITLERVRYYLCASPKYLEQHGYPEKLEDLRSHYYLTHSHRKKNYLINTGKEEVIVEPYFYLDSFQGLVNLAVQGVGIVWVSQACLGNHLANGNLVELLPEKFKDCFRPIYLYYKETKYVSPKVRAFVDFIKECMIDAKNHE